METLVTKREWLAKQGLAEAGKRGRFSTEANAALTKALEDGMRFSDDKPATSATAPLSYDAKKVRKWAAAQGINVGERGRIPAEVIARYNAENGSEAATAEVASPEVVVESVAQERVREEDVAYGRALRPEGAPEYLSEPVVGFSECGRCKRLVAFCPCEGGPYQPADLTNTEMATVPALLAKPE